MNESEQAVTPEAAEPVLEITFELRPEECRRADRHAREGLLWRVAGLAREVLENIRCGFRLAFFRRLDPAELHSAPGAFAALALFEIALHLAFSFAEAGPSGEFVSYYLAGNLLHIPLMLFAGLCLARLTKRDELALALPAAYLAIGIPLDLLALLLTVAREHGWAGGAWADLSPGHYYPLFGWWVLASLVATLRLAGTAGLRRLGAAAVFAATLVLPLWNVQREELWVAAYEEPATFDAPGPASEETLYAQPALLEGALGGLLPGRKGTDDLYFVGFAGDGGQDVFLNEVEAIEGLFRERFDTAGRSVVLANNPRTTLQYPIASTTALKRTLERVGAVMNQDEDILFLYLTSHGSEDHQLLTNNWPLRLRQIDPPMLKRILDESGIRWRVVVVSACYAGGFIEPLKDERTAVMTAADAANTSFGCDDGADFTWFGKALFDEELRRSHSFIGAFERASATIAQREKQEGETPSNPQLFVGEAIRSHLSELEERLEKLFPSDGEPAPQSVMSRSE
jgi:hypothetical protein